MSTLTPETERRLGNLNNLGRIFAVNVDDGTCRVDVGDNQTDWIPFRSARMGACKIWLPPSIGEQVEVTSSSGELSTAYVGGSIHCNDNGIPTHPTHPQIHLPDGAVFRYDLDQHQLLINLPIGGSAQLDVEQVEITGTATATDFVTKEGVSLANHLHSHVKVGPSLSGPPSMGGTTGGGSGGGSSGGGDTTGGADVTQDEFSGDMVAWYLLARG
jgi:phage baseplate assembly protein V